MTITENKELIFTDFEEKTQCVSTETIKEMWKAYKKSKEPVQTSCANYERDNVETETYTITADKYFHQDFKKLVNIDAPILSEMEQNVADYVAKKDGKKEYMQEQVEKLINDSPKHYDNSNGSLYNFCEKQKLNTWEFDIIKRVIRCRKKGQFEEDLKKTKFLIDLYLKEYN